MGTRDGNKGIKRAGPALSGYIAFLSCPGPDQCSLSCLIKLKF